MDEIIPKYSEWLTNFTFDNCAVGRKAYGEFLASYLVEEKDGFVLNLNGKWGTGKTEFLKRMYSHLHTQNHPVIYIDAWESDFTENPLLVVASELLAQLKTLLPLKGDDIDKLTVYLGKFFKGTAIVAGSFIGEKLIQDGAAGREFVKSFMESSPEDLLDTMRKGYSEQVEAVKDVRTQLEHLALALEEVHERKLPVMVLVDELDRCRPSYAIEMLEVIKHFFNTKNFVFVVATDTQQLENSINAVYGEKFDSSVYLRRFFNRKAELGEPDIAYYLEKHDFTIASNIVVYPDKPAGTTASTVAYYLAALVKAYNLDLRTVDQVIAKMKACLRTIARDEENSHAVNIFALLTAIIEFDERPEVFKGRVDDNALSEWEAGDFPMADFDVNRETLFSDYYALNMNATVKHTHTQMDQTGDTISQLVYSVNSSEYRVDNDASSMLRQMQTSISNKMDSRQFTVWMWSDFKELVKLSKSFE